jgi:hypothetical protein
MHSGDIGKLITGSTDLSVAFMETSLAAYWGVGVLASNFGYQPQLLIIGIAQVLIYTCFFHICIEDAGRLYSISASTQAASHGHS